MKIDFTASMCDLYGKPVPDADGEPLTLGTVVVTALMAPGKNRAPDEMLRRFLLAQRVVDASEIEIKVDEAARIKAASGEALTTLAFGRVCEALGEFDPS